MSVLMLSLQVLSKLAADDQQLRKLSVKETQRMMGLVFLSGVWRGAV